MFFTRELYVHALFFMFELLVDCYWTLFKCQLQNPNKCLDDGPNFVDQLTTLGKILYIIRPLMIRKKKRIHVPQVQQKQTKIIIRQQDVCYNPIGTKIYYSLVSNYLQKPCAGFIKYIDDHKFGTIKNNYDNIIITTSSQEIPFIDTWLNSDNMLYLMTFNICEFPKFSEISMVDEIKEVLHIQNAGGSSEISEALSMHTMKLKFHACNFIPEMAIEYSYGSKICDYITTIGNNTIGVSVTRAISYPFNEPFSLIHSTTLLYKKLMGIVIAQKNIVGKYYFDTSIIHVWCKNLEDMETIRESYIRIIDDDIYNLFRNIHIICSISNSKFIYTNNQFD